MSPGKNERSNGVEGVKHIVPFFKTTEIHKGKLSWQGANTNYQDQKDLCNKGKLDRDVHSALHEDQEEDLKNRMVDKELEARLACGGRK